MIEYLDTDAFPDKRSAIADALAGMDSGTLTVCRGDWTKCGGEICAFCARIKVIPGMNADDVLSMAQGHEA